MDQKKISKGKKGLCILTAAKKKTFSAEPKFLEYKDFRVCDEADNGIQLWYLPFSEDVELPRLASWRATEKSAYMKLRDCPSGQSFLFKVTVTFEKYKPLPLVEKLL